MILEHSIENMCWLAEAKKLLKKILDETSHLDIVASAIHNQM